MQPRLPVRGTAWYAALMFAPTLALGPSIDALIDLALAEDVGLGDLTTEALVAPTQRGTAVLEAREALVFCGRPVVERLLTRWPGEPPRGSWAIEDGARAVPGEAVLRLEGNLRALLLLERTLLNFVQRLSGIATQAARYVQAVEGTHARIVDTRKTIPGWRALDKYAVRVGGAHNHRAALDGGILVKDNHLACVGSVAEAVRRARWAVPHLLKVEVEVEGFEQLDAALAAGADVVMLDNFTPEQVAEAVKKVAGRVPLEASGGITLDNVAHYARAGVDYISVGALTHSVRAADLALEVVRD
ncbi:MAG: carboxylating nicotinate-nucleotide diphosphorylase [Bradymonadia bacterium]